MTVAWISDYPIEWMADPPPELQGAPRQHPMTWMPVLLEELQQRAELKLHVVVLRKTVPRDFEFQRGGVVFHVLKTRAGLRMPSLFWMDTVLIRRALKRLNPDLVHAWGTERGAALVASRLKWTSVVTMQGLLSWYEELVPPNWYERIAAWVERASLRRARVVTTESSFAVNYLRQRYPSLQVRQAEHAPNWLFHRLERRPQTAPVRFIAVGTVDYRKGSDLMLRALGRLVSELRFELTVVGAPNAALLAALRAELPAALWERIQFKTHLSPSQVAEELATATISVLPTRADTSPNAVKEAVVAGVPVVATRVGGVVDYVVHGENGLLVDSEDLDGLTAALREAARHPLFGQGRVNAETRLRMREYLSPERMVRNFCAAYEAAMGTARAG
ncbi:MAG TPA: glycosyltransferase family 4 protein [Verrucomicrobiae bacterium]|nr:glycosyltransferase family 4 protein [Verrucomicrobiae bacterium]